MASFPFSFWRLGTGGGSSLGLNYGYQFDGTKSIDFGNVLDNDGTQAFSVSFRTRDIANSEWIITKQSARYEGLEINSDGNRKMGFSLGRNSTDRIACTSVDAVPLNQWNHWVMTYDGSKTVAGVSMYMNGVSQSITTVRDTFAGSSSNSGNFNIGSLVWSVNNWLDCRLDDVQWYDFVLNSTQVNDIYNNGYVTAPTAAPIHHWKMGESDTWDGSNWTVVDEIGSLGGTSSNMLESDRKMGVGYSMTFDGVDEYVDFPNTVCNYGKNDAFTIAYWWKSSSNSIVSHLSKYSNLQSRGIYFGQNFYLYFALEDDVTGTMSVRTTIGGNSNIYDGNWHFIVGTYDGSNTNTGLTLYFDDTAYTTRTGGPLAGNVINTQNFEIAKRGGSYHNAEMMYVSIFNTELSSGDITTLYNNGVPTDPRDLSLTPTFLAPLGGENDTWDGSNWTFVDEIDGNNGTSVNMEEQDKTSDTP